MSPPIKEKENNELEQLATSVVLLDKNLNIKYLNPSAEILFQISLKKVKDKNISCIFEDIDYLKYRIDKSIQRSSKIQDMFLSLTFFNEI
jgi:two-component system nitrogen regulation sensor histidine kinase GlnL